MSNIIQWININQGTVMVLLTLSYVVITVFLFCSNNRMRKQTLMLELLDRRVDIYTEVRKFISKILSAANCTNDELQQYMRNTREAKFLFKKEVVDYLDEIYKKGLRLKTINHKLEESQSDRDALFNDNEEILDWFVKQLAESVSVFDEYININKMRL